MTLANYLAKLLRAIFLLIIAVYGVNELFTGAKVVGSRSQAQLEKLLEKTSFSSSLFPCVLNRKPVNISRSLLNSRKVCIYNTLTSKLGVELSPYFLLDHSCKEGEISLFSIGMLIYGEGFNYTGLSSVHETLRAKFLGPFSRSAVYSILILNEPPRVQPQYYQFLRESPEATDISLIIHHGAIADLPLSNAFPWPTIDSWIPVNMWGMYEKTESCSMIASSKRGSGGYDLRGEVIDFIISSNVDCEIFGGSYQALPTKDLGLLRYRFSIVIENSRSNGRYFTEKILDAIALGTVPLYWGTPFADRVFDDAIISWQTLDDLMRIIPTLSPQLYSSMVPALRRAQLLARWFASPENFLWDHCFSCVLLESERATWVRGKSRGRVVPGLASSLVERELNLSKSAIALA